VNTEEELFGTNGIRLTPVQWVVTILASLAIVAVVPRMWYQAEGFEAAASYRVPYAVSADYALYERHVASAEANDVLVIGDSVIWGEYVSRNGTLSHFLTESQDERVYVNAGVNGLFPLALEGLVKNYGTAIANRKVILHCNMLWMSSPEADLNTKKERVFNHVELVPQFRLRIPCYRADVTERTAIVARRTLPHLRWVRHLQVAYYDGASVPDWTLQDDGKYPPTYPNAYRNPLDPIRWAVPTESLPDAQRGIESSRHQPWNAAGRGQQIFEWVALDGSLQWAAFQRLVKLLRHRGNDVLVVMGPFNEHMVSESSRAGYQANKEQAEAWFQGQSVPVISPTVLPSELYGDASHPLTGGYKKLAAELLDHPEFKSWVVGHFRRK
jgi:hypothetical protein